MTAEQTQSLARIEESLEELAKKEKRTNGLQIWLWLVQAVVVPVLAFNSYNVIQMSGNRYTSRDAAAHQKEHVELIREQAIQKSKLSGLPPRQIDKNTDGINALRDRLIELDRKLEAHILSTSKQ